MMTNGEGLVLCVTSKPSLVSLRQVLEHSKFTFGQVAYLEELMQFCVSPVYTASLVQLEDLHVEKGRHGDHHLSPPPSTHTHTHTHTISPSGLFGEADIVSFSSRVHCLHGTVENGRRGHHFPYDHPPPPQYTLPPSALPC